MTRSRGVAAAALAIGLLVTGLDEAEAQTSIREIVTLRHGETLDDYQVLRQIALTPDGARAATVSYGLARVWNARTGKLLWELSSKYKSDEDTLIAHPVFSPDGSLLALAVRGEVALYAAADGTKLARLTGHDPVLWTWRTPIAFSPDGNWLLTTAIARRDSKGPDGAAWIFPVGDRSGPSWLYRKWRGLLGPEELPARHMLMPLERPKAQGDPFPPEGWVQEIRFSRDSAEVLMLGSPAVFAYSVSDGREVRRFGPTTPRDQYRVDAQQDPWVGASGVSWLTSISPSGRHVVECTDGTLWIRPAERNPRPEIELPLAIQLRGLNSLKHNCVFSPDGIRIAAWWPDQRRTPIVEVNVWDMTGKPSLRYFAPGREGRFEPAVITALHWSGDGRRIVAVDSAKTLRVFDPERDELLVRHQRPDQGKGDSLLAVDHTGTRFLTDRVGREGPARRARWVEAQVWEVVVQER